MFRRRAEQRRARAKTRLGGLDVDAAVTELAAILDEDGYLARAEKVSDGFWLSRAQLRHSRRRPSPRLGVYHRVGVHPLGTARRVGGTVFHLLPGAAPATTKSGSNPVGKIHGPRPERTRLHCFGSAPGVATPTSGGRPALFRAAFGRPARGERHSRVRTQRDPARPCGSEMFHRAGLVECSQSGVERVRRLAG